MWPTPLPSKQFRRVGRAWAAMLAAVASDLAKRIGAVLDKTRMPRAGLVIGVDAAGETGFWHRGRLPDGPRSILEIGSITKVFTTTLLADMAREGVVALDDPVQRHLPDGVCVPVRGREITLEDLATHRSGLPGLPKGLLWRALVHDRRDPYASLDAARLETAVGATRPRREPGRKLVYSNYGMGLLGYALAFRAGTGYERLVRARICEPLGLADTWIETPASERRRVAAGHNWRGRETPHWRLAALAGAGGLRSTAADLLAFLRLHAARAYSPHPAARETGSTESPLEAAARETARRRAAWRKVGIGLGWLIVPPGRHLPRRRLRFEVLLHEGGTGGFRSFAAVVPETGAAVVMLANQARSVGRLGVRLLEAATR
jgi:D-alanyl-D-alanine-carboxypeptidase/D-alanyl-D-alanine-endopeptidase